MDSTTFCETCGMEFRSVEHRRQFIAHRIAEHPELVHDCGFPEDSFACKIRHQQVAPLESSSNIDRWDRAAGHHGNTFGRGVQD